MKKVVIPGSVYLLSLAVVLSFLLFSCKPAQQPFDSKDLSYIYNPAKNPLNPRFNIRNRYDDSSVLSVKFSANDLFFSEANPEGIPTAVLLVTVKLFNISQGRSIADTAVYNMSIVKEKGRIEYLFNIPLRVEKGIDYMAEIKILDRIRMQVVQSFVPFNTLSDFTKYNFYARGHFEKNELFNPVLRVNEYVNVVYLKTGIDSLYISYFRPVKDIPDPPSMMLPETTPGSKPDQLVAIKYSDTIPMMLPREGIYHFSVRRGIKEGFTLFNLGASFPAMTTPEAMIEPLAYLATQDELAELRASQNQKIALDEFWIKRAGNIEKARELIKIYYSRVLYANYYFTSFKEGWRTERGMIYVIYGPPDKVYKTNEGENWGYRKPVIESSWGGKYTVREEYLYFTFKKRENRFSDNDFYLSRSETIVTFWDQAIKSWRNGIVYRLDNPEDI
jgi:GWxTD domain-containing protein